MRRRPTIYDGNQPHPHPYVVEDPREAALPESHFVTLDNLLIHYVHHTVSAEATTVVMMHGFSGGLDPCRRSFIRVSLEHRQFDQLYHHAAVERAGPAVQSAGL